MTLALRPARATDVYRLQQLQRTPGAPCWVAEVETWAIRDAWYWLRDTSNREAALLLAEDDEGDVIAVIGYSRAAPSAWYLPGLFVPFEHRGRNIGGAAFRTCIDLLRQAHGGETALWVVHHSNGAMLKLSAEVRATISSVDFPCNGGQPERYHRCELRL